MPRRTVPTFEPELDETTVRAALKHRRHVLSVPLGPQRRGASGAVSTPKYPESLKPQLHTAYCESYLNERLGVSASERNMIRTREALPVSTLSVSATFRAQGQAEDRLFMTEANSKTVMAAAELLRAEDIWQVNLVRNVEAAHLVGGGWGGGGGGGEGFADAAAGSSTSFGAAAPAGTRNLRSTLGMGDDDATVSAKAAADAAAREAPRRAGVTYEEFVARFAFPFCLREQRSTRNHRVVRAKDEYDNAVLRDAASGRSRPRRGGPPPAHISRDGATVSGIPWNPFLSEDLDAREEALAPFRVMRSQMREVQDLTVSALPLADLSKRLGAGSLSDLCKQIRSLETGRIVARLCHLLCWTLMEGGASRAQGAGQTDGEWENAMLTAILTSWNEVTARLKRRGRQGVLFHLPILLLCIRGCCETLLRDQFPRFIGSEGGSQLLQQVDDSITELFDPERWHSRLSIVESRQDSMRALRGPRGARLASASNGVFGTSAVIRSLFEGDGSSALAKKRSSVAAPRRSSRDDAGAQLSGPAGEKSSLPLPMRQALFRSAMHRVAGRAAEHGVWLTQAGHGSTMAFGGGAIADAALFAPELDEDADGRGRSASGGRRR